MYRDDADRELFLRCLEEACENNAGTGGTPTNNSPYSPIPWNNPDLQYIIASNPVPGGDANTVNLLLMPGYGD
jgi:hypothetical protein